MYGFFCSRNTSLPTSTRRACALGTGLLEEPLHNACGGNFKLGERWPQMAWISSSTHPETKTQIWSDYSWRRTPKDGTVEAKVTASSEIDVVMLVLYKYCKYSMCDSYVSGIVCTEYGLWTFFVFMNYHTDSRGEDDQQSGRDEYFSVRIG